MLASAAQIFATRESGVLGEVEPPGLELLTDAERDYLLLRIDANLRAFGALLDEYRPLLARAQTRVQRFGRKS